MNPMQVIYKVFEWLIIVVIVAVIGLVLFT
jgi:hypothetical protein